MFWICVALCAEISFSSGLATPCFWYLISGLFASKAQMLSVADLI
jgi:hypothetical protein|nr:MAG TPA: hypothetical protein [Bacteriophage sp.]